MDDVVTLEGFDYAASLLQRYDATHDTWALPREGDLWDAVAIARDQGLRGSGRTLAIIDAGFDADIPVLTKARVIGPRIPTSNHGTAVALLVHEVAPEANLILISARVDGNLEPNNVAKCIREAVSAGADVINLSLSVRIPFDQLGVHDGPGAPRSVPYTGPMAEVRFDWRATLSIPSTAIGDAVAEAAAKGVVVVAASGNRSDSVSIPAALAEAFSVGFLVVRRSNKDSKDNIAVSPPVGYSQSIYSDFQLLQPQGVLGTSFATPLVSGFCALMKDPGDLAAYREVVINSSNADGLAQLDLNDEMVQWILNLYRRALESMPHQHSKEEHPVPCPECSVFAVPTYCNAGLFALRLGYLQTAERLLRTARAVAPLHIDSAANLAMTLAAMADSGRADLAGPEISALLEEAADHMAFAYDRRPQNKAFGRRLAEFALASQDPTGWQLGEIPEQ